MRLSTELKSEQAVKLEVRRHKFHKDSLAGWLWISKGSIDSSYFDHFNYFLSFVLFPILKKGLYCLSILFHEYECNYSRFIQEYFRILRNLMQHSLLCGSIKKKNRKNIMLKEENDPFYPFHHYRNWWFFSLKFLVSELLLTNLRKMLGKTVVSFI